MIAQLRAISSKPGYIIVFQGTIEGFMEADRMLEVVFSFSTSFCTEAIKSLQSLDVPVYGCSFMHDRLEDAPIGTYLVMSLIMLSEHEPRV